MQKHYKYIKNNQDGAILVIVMMALTVLSLLGLALATASFANIKLTTVDRDYQATYYVAEGGANQTYAEIETLVESIYETTNTEASFYSDLNSRIEQQLDGTSISDFEESFTEQPSAKVKVEQVTDGNPRSYQIVSEGIIGKRTRTVTKPFQVNWKSGSGGSIEIPDNLAALVQNEVITNDRITGNIAINLSKKDAVSIQGEGSINGIVYAPELIGSNVLNYPGKYNNDTYSGKIPEVKPIGNMNQVYLNAKEIIDNFPAYPTYEIMPDEQIKKWGANHDVIKSGILTINQATNEYVMNLDKNIALKKLHITGANTLEIKTNGENREIVLDELSIQQGEIKITGGGNLTIYVEETIDFHEGTQAKLNLGGTIDQLTIYLKGFNKKVDLSGDSIIGSFFAQGADIYTTSTGGIQGHLLTGGNKVVVNGTYKNNTLLLAPNATVDIVNSGTFNGTVIADRLFLVGSGSLTYKEVNLDDFPFGSSSSPSTDDLIEKQPTVELN
ncbi:pilus assembly PilX N-terminal domain-containing protein [Paraliobacillus sp. X-1268]|uniref:pilus assembly PilX N-terminal domain-containing protein n=1 Tax=Paraliobacillus sp. X-1268 TaxID=2213193 RepID=UPI000E3E23C9|nr:pilus assembly PilX N-terminal domain-containing protein [Paraliobacillus sp. X-1268]